MFKFQQGIKSCTPENGGGGGPSNLSQTTF